MIKQITLIDFYSFRQETIILNPEVNVLIGINGSGKSNFLRAVQLLQEGMSDRGLSDYVLTVLGAFDNISFKGGSDHEARNAVELKYRLDCVRINEGNYGYSGFQEDLDYTIRLVRYPGSQNYFVEEKLAGSKPDPFVYLDFKNGHGHLSERNAKDGNRRLIRYDDYDPQQLVLSKVHDSDRYLPIATVRKALRDIVVYDYFDTTRSSPIRKAAMPRSEKRLSEAGDNLAQMLVSIKNNNRSDYKQLIEAAQEVNAHFSDFGTNILPGGYIEITLGEDHLNSSVHVSGISDGTLRYLCLLAILYNSERGKLVCIDEPEVGLHPDMIHNLANAVRYASQTSTVVLCTHSVGLLNQFELEHVRVIEKNESNATIVKSFTEEQFEGWYEAFTVGNMWQAGDIGGRRYGQ